MGMQPDLAREITKIVETRTHQRLHELTVEVQCDSIVLRGVATTFHVKQLAQHGVLDLLPGMRIDNAIEVVR